MITNFKQDLLVIPSKQEEKKKMELDAYRLFISEALPGYICFMEALNNTINALQEKNTIGKTKLRARLKAVNSALINTQKKILDDVFGFEIVTDSERDKEVLMLLIHNLFIEKYFSKIFPDLGPYVIKNLTNEPSLPSDKCDEGMAWSIIKNKIINNSFILPDAREKIGIIERN